MNLTTGTVAKTIEDLAPIILAAAAASGGSSVAVNLAISLIQAAMQMSQAGQITSEELAVLFETIGKSVNDTHVKWASMNATQKV
jgi:hypothetical protein